MFDIKTNIIWNSALAVTGAAVGVVYGGWSTLLSILLGLVIADYITGLGASWVEGKLSSKVGMKGIPKKILIFVMVAVSHFLDQAVGNAGHMFRDAALFFYIGNETISILENAGRAGLPTPAILRKAILILKNKGDGPQP